MPSPDNALERMVRLARLVLTREVMTFLAVGGTGYVVDVSVFNLVRANGPLAGHDPLLARTVAVSVAMCVTYAGNRTLTWRGASNAGRRREVALFVVFNVIGFAFSVATLFVSHDLLGMTSRLADNMSANVVGLLLGTSFRFLTYRRYVFATAGASSRGVTSLAAGPVGERHLRDVERVA